MIGVDFDLIENGEERSELEVLIYVLRWKYICSIYRCKVCKTRKGLHLKVFADIEPERAIPIRVWLGDDLNRLELDIFRLRKMCKLIQFDTLFQFKKELWNGKESIERCLDFEAFFKSFLSKL